MVAHTVANNPDQEDIEDDENVNDYDDENTAVTYSFTLENNRPLVVQVTMNALKKCLILCLTVEQAISNEDQNVDEKVSNYSEAVVNAEEDNIVCEPIKSKFVVNFKPEEEGDKRPDIHETVVEEKAQAEDSEIKPDIESAPEKKDSTAKSKIMKLFFGCFRKQKSKNKED